MAGAYEIQESATSRAGVQYEVANGDEIPNLCETIFVVVTEEGTLRGMRPQVADVSKCEPWSGPATWLSLAMGTPESSSMNRETGEMNIVNDGGFDYLMRLHVVPPTCRQPFAGQVGIR